MSISLEHDEARSLIRLEGAIDMACAAELKKLLLKVLEPGREVRVCFGRTTSLDTTVIELLWAAQRAALCSDVHFVLAGEVPARVSAALTDAGLEKTLYPAIPVPPSEVRNRAIIPPR